ncbi:MAG: Fe-S cluster assembly protein HesB [Actinomycetota bacterium]|nr:Fe-S cluster assembly protein HesB [Actinomycetota bacterium]
MRIAELRLVGPGGEPVDLWRTINSHGITELPPLSLDENAHVLSATLRLPGGGARTVTVGEFRPGYAGINVAGRRPGSKAVEGLREAVAHILRLDEDLSPFYAVAAKDPELGWVTQGAGRMVRSATVFEEVVKTICTTNCSWSATRRMVSALVEHLGEGAPGAGPSGPGGRCFPTPAEMASAGESFYREVARAGYRWRYLHDLAVRVAVGELELEQLGRATPAELSDDELEARLLALPGVGPYAAAHVMMMMGRYSRLILDSWTRPTYLRLAGKRSSTDTTIRRRFARYGGYAGLAFWLFVTQDWVEDAASPLLALPTERK